MMDILITGASGQLGHDLAAELTARGHHVVGVSSKEMDVTDPTSIWSTINFAHPDAVLHCASYTAVDKAEDEPEKCELVNRAGTEILAKACGVLDIPLLYISTDYVFPGTGERPWEPEDPTAPLNVYGLSKLQGEEAVRAATKKHFIVRISWLFGVNGKNFVKTMLRLGAEKEEIRVVCDQIGSPTYTRDLSVLLADMIVTEKYGTYHATNEGFCSWYEFANEIIRRAGLPARVVPVPSGEYPTRAKRPLNSRMSKEKLTENGFDRLPSWQDALDRFLRELEE